MNVREVTPGCLLWGRLSAILLTFLLSFKFNKSVVSRNSLEHVIGGDCSNPTFYLVDSPNF